MVRTIALAIALTYHSKTETLEIQTSKCFFAQMAVRSPYDRKIVGPNPAGSYETVFLSESHIDALTLDNIHLI